MTRSKFLETGRTFLPEAASYLEDRCLTIEDVDILPYCIKNHGLSTESGEPYLLEGWAYVLRGEDGEPLEGQYLMRVCNYPDFPLFQQRGKLKVLWNDRPKFIQTFKGEFLHFTAPVYEVCHSNVVMIHEKISSAQLATKVLGVPCMALSGCAGWSNKGALAPRLAKVISNLAPRTRLVVCFDGDIQTNHNIMIAAQTLKGWIKQLRPDIEMCFPSVPENSRGVGWDDWAVEQGESMAANWARLLTGEGIEIADFIPAAFLIQEFQLEVKELKSGGFSAKHTLDNYRRLLKFPRWAHLGRDISGRIYDRTDTSEAMDFDKICTEFQVWLERGAYRADSEAVRPTFVRRALLEHLQTNEFSMPLELLSAQDPVTREQAEEAAIKLITEGLRVIGPMTQGQTVETLMRMFRDMVALWSTDKSVDVQWALALVGPSGCGKSNFPRSLLGCFAQWGYTPAVAQLPKEGAAASLQELYRITRNSMVGVFDEYDPAEHSAKVVERNIFTLSTTRTTMQRMLYSEEPTECTRHATLMLTTTDKNRKYIRSGKGEGERRFITLEVQGVKPYGGKLASDREVITECGKILLRYGYQLYTEGYEGDATEYSCQTTDDYLGDSPVIERLAMLWARGDLYTVLKKAKETYYRKGIGGDGKGYSTGEGVRITMPILYDIIAPGERLSRQEKSDLRALIEGCGAKKIGQGRVWQNGKSVMKDEVWEIKDWDDWSQSLMAKL